MQNVSNLIRSYRHSFSCSDTQIWRCKTPLTVGNTKYRHSNHRDELRESALATNSSTDGFHRRLTYIAAKNNEPGNKIKIFLDRAK